MSLLRFFILTILMLSLSYSSVLAEKAKEEMDQIAEDGEEVAEGVSDDPRFVPVPMPIGNPTIGTGLGLNLIYLHDPSKDKDLPTSTSGMFVAYTNTESRMGGLFHSGHYLEDHLRLSGGIFGGLFKIKYYGVGEDSPIRDNPLDYETTVFSFVPQALYRLPLENWFLGGRYTYVQHNSTFKFSSLVPDLPDFTTETETAGPGLVAQFDSRDNTRWPSSGQFFEMIASDYDENWGGDYAYQKLKIAYRYYHPLTPDLTIAGDVKTQFIDGNAPFYDLSGIELRGFPRGLFVDDHAAALTGEVRWQLAERWATVAFAGGGRIADSLSDFVDNKTYYAGGTGLRYMINREQKLNLGIDVTYGNDSWEYYIVIGDSLR